MHGGADSDDSKQIRTRDVGAPFPIGSWDSHEPVDPSRSTWSCDRPNSAVLSRITRGADVASRLDVRYSHSRKQAGNGGDCGQT